MALVDDMIAGEEDRLSNLPDEIIHRILSFHDFKFAIQTCTLSKKWKLIWTSMPHLNINTQTFPSWRQSVRFMKNALSHRNNGADVSAVTLTFTGKSTRFVNKSIINYAYSHNVKHLTMTGLNNIPRYLFSCHSLKHLTLAYVNRSMYSSPTWDFPALETLSLTSIEFGDPDGETKSVDLFSKCVNLKDLSLHMCCMEYLESFVVCAPQLSNLTITEPIKYPQVFKVVAPQLQNLTASVNGSSHNSQLKLSTEEGFNSLEKVNLSIMHNRYTYKLYGCMPLDLFQNVGN